ncbi:potassium channel subfamily K member 2-like [Physella acuta]|uniref:potassium channel subfamily K member 2-like n=1 Tax=Physella acuta TaxID=109671 RepID=UPI0027DDBDD2|nr:potassium channel subfamily K member 2-like [Physella acuta]
MRAIEFTVLTTATILYLLTGGVIFHFLEDESETEAKLALLEYYTEFLGNNTCLTARELQDLVQKTYSAHDRGIVISNISGQGVDLVVETSESKWDVVSSILFCVIVITTIGYGNMSPSTSEGLVFCIVYALLGIPLFGALLVELKVRLVKAVHYFHDSKPWVQYNDRWDRRFKSFFLLVLGASLTILLPSSIFSVSQNWTYLESVYYSVITLTTVGFGDLIPAKRTDMYGFYIRLVLGLWMVVGLSCVTLVLGGVSITIKERLEKIFNRTKQVAQIKPSKLKTKLWTKSTDNLKAEVRSLQVSENIVTQHDRSTCLDDI